MNVRYTPGAIRQIVDAVDRIAKDDPFAAGRFSAHIEQLGWLLSRHPDIGRSTNVTGLRVFPAEPYPCLVFYRPKGLTSELKSFASGTWPESRIGGPADRSQA